MSFFRSGGSSSRSASLRAGRMNVLMPCRRAASAFSRMPPTGSTRPRSVISPVIATSSRTGWLRDRRHDRGRHRDAGRRTVLRDRAGRHVHVQIVVVEEVGRDAELGAVRADVADRRARRLLHHVAELAGEDDVAAAARQQARLDEQHVAAGLGPRDAGGHAGPRRPERRLAWNRGGPRYSATCSASTRVARRRPGLVGRRGSRRRAAILRATAPICRSRLRTPASRVYSRDDPPQRIVGDARPRRRAGRAPPAAAESGTGARCEASPPRCSRRAR